MKHLPLLILLALSSCEKEAPRQASTRSGPVVWHSDGSATNVQWLHNNCAGVDPIPPECVPFMGTPAPTPKPSPSVAPTATQTPVTQPTATATATSTATTTATPTATAKPSPSATAAPTTTPTVTPSSPQAPSQLTAKVVKGKDIQLNWQDNSTSETSFEVQRSEEGSAFITEITLPADTTTWTDTTTVKKQRYWYRVRANDSGWSNTAVITP
jgi:hypothetical protein